jgi:membrane-associated phospholipid phosphatase
LAFLGGFFVNKSVNERLKELFKQPRPVTMDLAAAQSRDLVFRFRKYMGYAEPEKLYVSKAHLYGMPSGHAQAVGYALGFLYFTKTKQLSTSPITSTLVVVFLTEILVSAITMYQRWESRAHTVAQIFLGFLVGGVISGCVYVTTKRFMEVLSRKNIA